MMTSVFYFQPCDWAFLRISNAVGVMFAWFWVGWQEWILPFNTFLYVVLHFESSLTFHSFLALASCLLRICGVSSLSQGDSVVALADGSAIKVKDVRAGQFVMSWKGLAAKHR